jgi:hypothetical protein
VPQNPWAPSKTLGLPWVSELFALVKFSGTIQTFGETGFCSIQFFWIVNPIQIHCKYVIVNPNPNPLFKTD